MRIDFSNSFPSGHTTAFTTLMCWLQWKKNPYEKPSVWRYLLIERQFFSCRWHAWLWVLILSDTAMGFLITLWPLSVLSTNFQEEGIFMNARGIAYTMPEDICLHKTYSNLLLRKDWTKPPIRADHADCLRYSQNTGCAAISGRLCEKAAQWWGLCFTGYECVSAVLHGQAPAYAIINDAVEITKKQIHGNMAKACQCCTARCTAQRKAESQARGGSSGNQDLSSNLACTDVEGTVRLGLTTHKRFVKRIWKQSQTLPA